MNCLQFFFLLMGRPFLASCQNDPVVKTSLGFILGTVDTSRQGNYFYLFRGIRYAEAPVGDFRFKPPVPVTAWSGISNATEDGPACPQKQLPNTSEDCLRLNVYTRQINNDQRRRPVLVYIHGGAFDHWSGQSTTHGSHYLIDYDIVLVTINYRLGTLGFFSTGDDYAPGNYGMKDQVQALKWIQNHIIHFGGDPTRVTISGESAGGASVGLHLVSPMSKGLFHGAIIQSGSPINSRTINKNPLQLAIRQAVLLNCTTNSTETMVNCVRKVPPEEIIQIYDGLSEKFNIGRLNSPVVEYSNCKSERFLEKDPLISLTEGDFAHVPVLIGTTKDEYIIRAINILKNSNWTLELSENWNEIAPIIFFYDRNDTISYQIKEFYLGGVNKSITNDSLDELADIFSDSYVIFSTVRTAKLIAEKNTKRVYLYQFNYLGDDLRSCFKAALQNRVAHEHDLLYIFNPSYVCPITFNITSANGQFVTQFTTLLKNFVEEGNPTPSDDLNIIWEGYTNSDPKYLDINETLTLVNDLYYKERTSFWESLFPLPH